MVLSAYERGRRGELNAFRLVSEEGDGHVPPNLARAEFRRQVISLITRREANEANIRTDINLDALADKVDRMYHVYGVKPLKRDTIIKYLRAAVLAPDAGSESTPKTFRWDSASSNYALINIMIDLADTLEERHRQQRPGEREPAAWCQRDAVGLVAGELIGEMMPLNPGKTTEPDD